MKSFNSILKSRIQKQKSWLCVGLDISPESLGSDKFDDLKSHTFKVIDSTKDYAVAYKPNFAFFERWGAKGFSWLEETVEYIGDDRIKIADAKRGDIGNTSKMYAEAFFNTYNFDSITLSPYMGEDSITPFLKFQDKWSIVLALTSNKGALDFQKLSYDENSFYYLVKNPKLSQQVND